MDNSVKQALALLGLVILVCFDLYLTKGKKRKVPDIKGNEPKNTEKESEGCIGCAMGCLLEMLGYFLEGLFIYFLFFRG